MTMFDILMYSLKPLEASSLKIDQSLLVSLIGGNSCG